MWCVQVPIALVDAAAWPLALALLGMDVLIGTYAPSTPAVAAAAVALQLGTGAASGLYTRRWRVGGYDEAYVLSRSVAACAVLLVVLHLATAQPLPLLPLVAAPLVLLAMASARWVARRQTDRRLRPAEAATRVVVVGAGEAGRQVVEAMLHSPTSPYLPVAIVDDDRTKTGLSIGGVPVLGRRDALVDVLRTRRASGVVVAVPSADDELVRDVVERVAPLGVVVKVVPPIDELLTRAVSVADIHPVDPADLLGRPVADLDLAAVCGYLAGRRVLVTGAGGSIGSELCRQINRCSPERLVMLDRDESALHGVQLSLEGHALLDDRSIVVADIRDSQRLSAVMAEHRPHVVFHAAALKHLPLLEMHPGEAVKTNVLGTLNVLEASAAWGVERFVNISTDKAADPCSVLGYSKRLAEQLTTWVACETGMVALSVRFGNVLGSRGSVLVTFAEQIRQGGPVTVTDPDVTRFFMTVEEAVSLVVQAGAVGGAGEALILDMGRPVRILDVARRMVETSAPQVRIEFTGLRPGEKLHEDLFGPGECDVRPVHPLISHVAVPPLDPEELRALAPSTPDAELVRRMRSMAQRGAVALHGAHPFVAPEVAHAQAGLRLEDANPFHRLVATPLAPPAPAGA
ncbi:hypothetical protein CAE01nite_18420 [Cellulomonas aerilata]|uniref:Ketoreductase domain-containing protein n=1 Tax=Cellulomonas aerilata TaxID=515326 RepID=A0A512DCG4_9CELL|nr:hypothetical protein CAE01nite_18420 [Cellulomonas aerilata]